MSNPAISILIPVYKVEQYLQRCIDSVLSQDFTDYELILVDDGSPDRCGMICDENACKDSRIKVVHKKNGGVVSARKVGFEASVAPYLVFLDSDDWLMPGALSTLYRKINEGYDIVRGRNWRVLDNGEKMLEQPRLATGELNGCEAYLQAIINASMSPYLWGAIYRRDLFSSQMYEQILPVSIGDDWVINVAIASKVKRVCLMEDIVYCYFINRASMMQQRVCSWEYGDMIERILYNVTGDAPAFFRFKIRENRICTKITNFFIPELPFSEEAYQEVKAYFEDNGCRQSVSAIVESKFMRFIDNKLLFRRYSKLYSLLFKWIKLKGIKRKLV
ncbi:glycosyltransferase family 2 protein [uncultured Bacteroides sp.]|uniref:glycosyltransferase family 2 protein n=1 Tax=uncultured Bacteroides sp. TaxID=162156 RepID=UPI0025E3DE8F|nr:glycosyltransferase family 2 protein [uncultured Bacteroides sp.]